MRVTTIVPCFVCFIDISIFKILDVSVSDNCKFNTTKASECHNLIKATTDQDVLVDNALIIDNGNILLFYLS